VGVTEFEEQGGGLEIVTGSKGEFYTSRDWDLRV